MDKKDPIFPCFICGREMQMNGGRYEGKNAQGYGFSVCNKPCLSMNWDGWNSMYESKILKYLESKNIETPQRNKNGLLPVEFYRK